MNKTLLFALLAAGLLAGCAPAVHRGSVAMKLSENEAHICLGKGDVKEGDKITLFRNVCSKNTQVGTKGSQIAGGPRCELRRIGEGQIATLLNNHYSVASFGAGIQFEEGDIVEKSKS